MNRSVKSVRFIYQTRMDTVFDNGKRYTVYGVDVFDGNFKHIKSIKDIFFEADKAEALAKQCNTENISPSYLLEYIEDIIDDPEKIRLLTSN